MGKDATIKDLAAKPDTLVAIMTDKDYLQEATGAYRLAITRIEHVIHIDGNTEEYAQFRTHANQRLANAKAAPLLERLGSLQDKAQKRSAEGKFQEALVLWDSILREGDGLPKQIPEYAVQKGHMMLARAAVLGAMGKLEEAEQQLVEAERLVNEGNLKALAVDLLEGIGKVRSIMRR